MLVNAHRLEDALVQLGNCASSKNSRPILQGIHIVYEDGTLTMESTDSYLGARFVMEVEPRDYDENTDIIIMPVKFKAGKFDYAELNLKDMYIRTDVKLALNIQDEGTYPNLERCFPADPIKETVSLNVGNLQKFLKGLAKDDLITVEFRSPVKPLVIESKKYSEGFEEAKMILSVCRKF